MPKHGGCALCKGVAQEILTSVSVGQNSIAVCDECKKQLKGATKK
ncbi:hypothetical protein [Brevibacillus massiliensis]|nr:hypothetical protein [Brevibacillus massiliensis]